MDMVTGRVIVLVNNRLGFVQIPGQLQPADLTLLADFHLCVVCFPDPKMITSDPDHVFIRHLSFY